jgi:predicted Rossmann-fold nucleotide-binding protein
LFWDPEITSEEENEKIKKVAELIHSHEMDLVAIFILESSKPLVFVGGQLGRAFTSPLFMILGDQLIDEGEKYFSVFEKRENIDKVIELLKKMQEEDNNKKNEAKKDINKKVGWRRYLPF